eukprot:PhF_6_TR600/c1_g1_i1/m.703
MVMVLLSPAQELMETLPLLQVLMEVSSQPQRTNHPIQSSTTLVQVLTKSEKQCGLDHPQPCSILCQNIQTRTLGTREVPHIQVLDIMRYLRITAFRLGFH